MPTIRSDWHLLCSGCRLRRPIQESLWMPWAEPAPVHPRFAARSRGIRSCLGSP